NSNSSSCSLQSKSNSIRCASASRASSEAARQLAEGGESGPAGVRPAGGARSRETRARASFPVKSPAPLGPIPAWPAEPGGLMARGAAVEDPGHGLENHLVVEWEDGPRAASVAEAAQVGARRAGRVDVDQAGAPVAEHLRLAVGTLHHHRVEPARL